MSRNPFTPPQEFRDEDSLQVVLTFNDGQRLHTRVWLNTERGRRRCPLTQKEKERQVMDSLNASWGAKAKAEGRRVVRVHLMRN